MLVIMFFGGLLKIVNLKCIPSQVLLGVNSTNKLKFTKLKLLCDYVKVVGCLVYLMNNRTFFMAEHKLRMVDHINKQTLLYYYLFIFYYNCTYSLLQINTCFNISFNAFLPVVSLHEYTNLNHSNSQQTSVVHMLYPATEVPIIYIKSMIQQK